MCPNPLDIVEDAIDFVVDVVVDVISWIIPTPEIPDFGVGEFDDYETGLLLNKQSNDASIPVMYGERLIGGTRIMLQSSGAANEYLYICLAIAEGEINAIDEIRINDKAVTWSGSLTDNTQRTVASNDDNFFKADPTVDGSSAESLITVEPHFGSDGQSASSLLSSLSNWGSNHKLSGICYLALKFKWNQDAFSGVPKVQVLIQGKKVVSYNSSLVAQTAAYSTNPAWCMLDFLTNERYGKGLAIADINLQSFYDASQICVTQVTPYSGGSDINIFETNAVLDTSKKVLENVRELIKGCRGYLPYIGGKYNLVIETTGSSTLSLNEDDVFGGIKLQSENKNNKYNRVIVSFINPARNYQVDEVQFPQIDDSGYATADKHATMKAADGGFLLEGRFDFKTITSPYQAEEMAEVILRRSRSAKTLSINASAKAYDITIGDIIDVTHSSLGYSSKLFRVVGQTFNQDFTVGLSLIEHADAFYTWATKNCPSISTSY